VTLPDHIDDWPPDARENYEERAGIMEHHGGMERRQAERLAERIVRALWRRRG